MRLSSKENTSQESVERHAHLRSLGFYLKRLLMRLGAKMSREQVLTASSIVNYLELGRWVQAGGFRRFPRYQNRLELHAAVGRPLASERVLYLEFGVFQGVSLRHWCGLLQNPLSSLHGFDSFYGLPERWNALMGPGTCNLDGRVPHFDDKRVVLHPGWFKDTLPSFVASFLPEYDRLVVHLDADLYSSTSLVLSALEDKVIPGTILIFDEFSDRDHELRAFDEFLERTGHRFGILGATTVLGQVAFQRVP
jgi:hypothetical protein